MSYDDVWTVLDREYEFKKGTYEVYSKVFKELRSLNGYENQSSTILVVAKVEDCFNPGKFVFDVFGLDEGDENHYAIEMTSWHELINFYVLQKSIELYGAAEVVAHILFKITFFGYSADVVDNRVAKEIEILKEYHDEIENGAVKSFSTEEIRAELGIFDKRTDEEKELQLKEFNRIQIENEKIYRELLEID